MCAHSIRMERGQCLTCHILCRAPSQMFHGALNTTGFRYTQGLCYRCSRMIYFLAFLYKKKQFVCSLLLLITYIVFNYPTIEKRPYDAKHGKNRYMTDSLVLIQIQSIYLAQIKHLVKVKFEFVCLTFAFTLFEISFSKNFFPITTPF